MIVLLLAVVGLVLLTLAALNVVPTPRPNLGWLGLAFWLLAEILLRAFKI